MYRSLVFRFRSIALLLLLAGCDLSLLPGSGICGFSDDFGGGVSLELLFDLGSGLPLRTGSARVAHSNGLPAVQYADTALLIYRVPGSC